VTTRIAKPPPPPKTPVVPLVCPAGRAIRKCNPVGSGSVGGKRREIIQCGDRACELVRVPQRDPLADTPQAA